MMWFSGKLSRSHNKLLYPAPQLFVSCVSSASSLTMRSISKQYQWDTLNVFQLLFTIFSCRKHFAVLRRKYTERVPMYKKLPHRCFSKLGPSQCMVISFSYLFSFFEYVPTTSSQIKEKVQSDQAIFTCQFDFLEINQSNHGRKKLEVECKIFIFQKCRLHE